MAILSVQTLRKEFWVPGHPEPLVAVEDVSFTVEQGQCLAIVGESGSGKTTCARIIAGLETQTGGTVTFHQPVIASDGTRRMPARLTRARRTQMVFQDPYSSLDSRQRVGKSIEEVLRMHGHRDRTARRAAVTDLLDKVGLDPALAAALPHRLSGGQRQRVAIARALAVRPQLLILDEAVSALDVSVQAQVLNLLNDLRAEEGLTYLFVSHDLAVVRQISDHCVVMRHGRVVEHGPTATVLDEPEHPYTQQLLAAVPRPGWQPRSRRAAPAPTSTGQDILA
jgi:ABC-type glutathione transport system ATPase component